VNPINSELSADVRFAAHYGLNSDIELGPKSANRRHTGKKKLPSDVYWFTYGYVATVISLDPISGPIRGRLAGPHNNGVQRC
jgi:hypothetical protein